MPAQTSWKWNNQAIVMDEKLVDEPIPSIPLKE